MKPKTWVEVRVGIPAGLPEGVANFLIELVDARGQGLAITLFAVRVSLSDDAGFSRQGAKGAKEIRS